MSLGMVATGSGGDAQPRTRRLAERGPIDARVVCGTGADGLRDRRRKKDRRYTENQDVGRGFGRKAQYIGDNDDRIIGSYLTLYTYVC